MSETAETAPARPGSEAIWHEAECGAYAADLPLWRELAAGAVGPVLDLGAGTGRVALDLAAAGYDVIALDSDGELLQALSAEAAGRGLELRTIRADAREPLPAAIGELDLVIAPMQLAHLMGGSAGRARMLGAAAAALRRGGRLALAVLEEESPDNSGAPEPLPDVRERNGWVHSSLPTEIRDTPEGIELHRLRQLVSPTGELTEAEHMVRLDRFDPARLEREASAHGFAVLERIAIAETERYVGSVAVILERIG